MHARFAFFGAVILAAALAACGGGGGGGGGTPPTTAPTSTPTGGPSYSTSVTLGAATSIPFSVSSFSGTASVPAGSGTVTVTISTTPNPTQLDLKRMQSNPANTPIVYITITSSASATLDAFPGFTVSGVPASSSPYFLAWYYSLGQTPAWTSTTETGVNVSGSGALTIPTLAIPTPLTINASSPLQLALYTGNYIPPINIFGCVGGNASPPPSGTALAHTNAVGVHPITSGDTYNYSGNLLQTITRIEPCPQPTATAAASVTIAVTTSVTAGVTQETDQESDAYALYGATLKTVADVATSTPGPTTIFYDSSETATDGNSNVETTTYTAPGLIYAEVPEAPTNSWTNSWPSSVNQSLSDGEVIDRTYGSGGTYTETDTLPGGNGTSTVQVNTDGSGSYTIGQVGSTSVVEYAFSAPASGGITLTTTAPGASASTQTIPNWFTASTFYSDSTQDTGPATLPSGCAFTISSNGTPEEIVRTIDITDPVLGYKETETIDNYDLTGTNSTGNGVGTKTLGPICSVITDSLSEYYDYSLNTPFGLFYTETGSPVLTNVITETLNLLTSGLVADVAHPQSASTALSGEVNALARGIRFTRELQRAKTMETFASDVRTHIAGGLK